MATTVGMGTASEVAGQSSRVYLEILRLLAGAGLV